MNKLKMLLSIILFACLISACSGSGGESFSPPSNGAKPEAIIPVSSRLLEDNRWEYKYTIDSVGFRYSKAVPACMGQHNGWRIEKIFDMDNDLKYELTITSFNREIEIAIPGDYDVGSWFDPSYTKYRVVKPDGKVTIILSLYEGNTYTAGTAPVRPLPGLFGDDFLRFTPGDNQLVIHANNNKLDDVVDKSFQFWNVTSWLPVNQAITDSSGWGGVTIPVTTYPIEISGGYGGNFLLERWVPPYKSIFYYLIGNNFRFCVYRDRVVPGACQ